MEGFGIHNTFPRHQTSKACVPIYDALLATLVPLMRTKTFAHLHQSRAYLLPRQHIAILQCRNLLGKVVSSSQQLDTGYERVFLTGQPSISICFRQHSWVLDLLESLDLRSDGVELVCSTIASAIFSATLHQSGTQARAGSIVSVLGSESGVDALSRPSWLWEGYCLCACTSTCLGSLKFLHPSSHLLHSS